MELALLCYTCVISLCLYQAGYRVFFTISFDLGFALFCMHGLAPKSYHRFYARTEALSDMIFVPAQLLSSIM